MSEFYLYIVDSLTGSTFKFFYFGGLFFFLVSLMFQLILAFLSSFTNFYRKYRFFVDNIGKYLTTSNMVASNSKWRISDVMWPRNHFQNRSTYVDS